MLSLCPQVLVPPLRDMEAFVFDQMVHYLWRALVEVRTASCLPETAASSLHGHTNGPSSQRIHRWTHAPGPKAWAQMLTQFEPSHRTLSLSKL